MSFRVTFALEEAEQVSTRLYGGLKICTNNSYLVSGSKKKSSGFFVLSVRFFERKSVVEKNKSKFGMPASSTSIER